MSDDKRPLMRDENRFRYLSPEPAPHELGIPADFTAPLDIRTTVEIMADRDEKRRRRRDDIIDVLHRYRRGEIGLADEAADQILALL